MMSAVPDNVRAVKARIDLACRAAGRSDVRMLAVSKGHPKEAIERAFRAGQTAFGENYLQEALDKIEALRDLAIEWHFIGPMQSNKAKSIAERFAWVHSVDRMKIAERLSQARPATMAPLQVCLQVNISGEATKSGVAPEALAALAKEVARLERIRLRGLMAIPEPQADPARQHEPFRRLRVLRDELNRQGHNLDTLSMGMTDDMEAAITEGATIVRIGTAIFGPRQ
jgi:PLP dependent protein